MGKDSVNVRQAEVVVAEMVEQARGIIERLVGWLAESGGLGELEQQVLASSQELGNLLLSGLSGLCASGYPAETVPCACGAEAGYQRQRRMQTTTLLGTIQVRRAYYLCGQCHQGVAPLDGQLGFCAGGFSAGLAEAMAWLGVTQDSFEQASQVLAKLTPVTVCPQSVRKVTETLGALALAEEQAQVQQAWEAPAPPVLATGPSRLYVSLDGTMVNIRREGWKEARLGVIYTTESRPSRKRPGTIQIRTVEPTYVADLTSAEAFGRLLWCEAARRGVEQAQEVIVLGDGAEWVWKLAAEHFPHATQIVDWYHASQYVWQAARAIHGESDLATLWAQRALTAMEEGRLLTLCANLKKCAHLEPVQAALTYFLNNQSRMHYDRYRARGLQIGSGTIESACKHLIAQRLKLAGMRWNRPQARAMLTLRARLKSRRWSQTFALYSPDRQRQKRDAA